MGRNFGLKSTANTRDRQKRHHYLCNKILIQLHQKTDIQNDTDTSKSPVSIISAEMRTFYVAPSQTDVFFC